LLWFFIFPATTSFLRNAGKKKSLASPLMRVSEFGVAQYLNSRNVSTRALCLFAHAITALVVRPVEHRVHILCTDLVIVQTPIGRAKRDLKNWMATRNRYLVVVEIHQPSNYYD
jgi:hypothetical protein